MESDLILFAALTGHLAQLGTAVTVRVDWVWWNFHPTLLEGKFFLANLTSKQVLKIIELRQRLVEEI